MPDPWEDLKEAGALAFALSERGGMYVSIEVGAGAFRVCAHKDHRRCVEVITFSELEHLRCNGLKLKVEACAFRVNPDLRPKHVDPAVLANIDIDRFMASRLPEGMD